MSSGAPTSARTRRRGVAAGAVAPGAEVCARRLHAVRAVVCVAFAAAAVMSWKLWLSQRAYPLVPVLDAFLPLPSPLDAAFAAAFVAALAAAALSRSVLPAIVALGFVFALALQDQSRWQPWAYQYVAMLAAIVALTYDDIAGGCERALDACRAVVSGIYFWSGVQKLNATFFSTGLAALVDEGAVSPGMRELLVRAGFAVPFVEAALGAGLLFPRTRRIAVVAAIGMHALLLALIGPFGQDWNAIVWPWNVAMIVLVVLLFGGRDANESGARRILALAHPRAAAHAAVAALFWLAPALSFVGAWDSYLSASLYSRNISQGAVQMSDAAAARLPADIRARVETGGWLWPMTWALDELNVPAVPEKRVYTGIARAMCRLSGAPEEVSFVFASKPDVFTGERDVTTYGCADIGAVARR